MRREERESFSACGFASWTGFLNCGDITVPRTYAESRQVLVIENPDLESRMIAAENVPVIAWMKSTIG
jgi:hypothetical protein